MKAASNARASFWAALAAFLLPFLGSLPPAEAQTRREKISSALQEILASRYKDQLAEVLDRIDKASSDAVDHAKLTFAVVEYARLVQKIESDLGNTVRLIEDLPDQERQEARVLFMLEQDGHFMDYDSVRAIVFGGAEVGVSLAALVGGSVSGGAAAAVDAAQLGIELLESAGGSAAGTTTDTGRIGAVIQGRVVLYDDHAPWVLSDEELALVHGAEGATLQERFENSTFLYDGAVHWLTPQWRKALERFASDNDLAEDMPWGELYGRFLDEQMAAADAAAGGGAPEDGAAEDRKARLETVRRNEPGVWACGSLQREDYQSGLESLQRVGDKRYASKFKPGGPGASWQDDASERCVKAYEAVKAKGRGDQAWDQLQRCAWSEEIAKRYEALMQGFDRCRAALEEKP